MLKPSTPEPVCQVFMVDKDDPGASDSNDGIPVAEGGTGPWLRIQHGLNRVAACDTLQIRASVSPYRETAVQDGEALGGLTLRNSGRADAPIVIEGYPGERPVIDQGRPQSDGSLPVVGLYLPCVSHVVVRNLDIRDTDIAGVTTAINACGARDIQIERLNIQGVRGSAWVAGIRLVGVREARVANNHIQQIITLAGPVRESPALSAEAGASDVEIANNLLVGLDAGVVLRSAAGQAMEDVQVLRNRVEQGELGVLLSAASDTGTALEAVAVQGNLAVETETWVSAEAGVDAAVSLSVINNSLIDSPGVALQLRGTDTAEIYDNLFVAGADDILVTVATDDDAPTRVAYMDHNAYWQFSPPAWTLDLGGALEARFEGLAAWSAAWSDAARPDLDADPDQAAVTADPLLDADYRPSPLSPLHTSGRYSGTIGAYFDGEPVGPAPE